MQHNSNPQEGIAKMKESDEIVAYFPKTNLCVAYHFGNEVFIATDEKAWSGTDRMSEEDLIERMESEEFYVGNWEEEQNAFREIME